MHIRVANMEGEIKRRDILGGFQAIKTRYGFNFDLSEDQIRIIEAVMGGKDVLGVLPTGSGKSMCFVLPPLLKRQMAGEQSTALVISPLLALSKDQVNDLQKRGIPAYMIGSTSDAKEILQGKADIIFAPPESLQLYEQLDTLRDIYTNKICVLQVFDEAHCISHWGNDVRLAYRRVTEMRSLFKCPALALTATITEYIRRDLLDVLCIKPDTVTVATLPDRSNIFLSMRKASSKFEELEWVILHTKRNGIRSAKVIIYTRSVNQCTAIFEWLWKSLEDSAYCHIPGAGRRRRIIEMFHANTDETSKARLIEEYPRLDSVVRVVVCTIAFGMGVDIPDIRVVVLWGIPKSTLDYWQETGRRCRNPSLNGLSVCYPYPASKSTCSESVRAIAELATCTRKGIMEEFFITGMSRLPEKEHFNGSCPTECECDLCRCCDNCMKECTCQSKKTQENPGDFLSRLG